MKRRGNCYVTCEALYHLLGGAAAGYKPHTVRHEGDVHWYLVLTLRWGGAGSVCGLEEVVVDPTASQFATPPPYRLGRGRGFLTKKPSKRARALMERLVWQGRAMQKVAGGRGARATAALRQLDREIAMLLLWLGLADGTVLATTRGMTTKTVKVRKSNPVIARLLRACLPDYRGNKVRVAVGDVRAIGGLLVQYADHGTRNQVVVYSLHTGGVTRARVAGQRVPLSSGLFIVERSWFQGADMGVTIYVSSLDALGADDLSVAVDAMLEGGRVGKARADALVAERIPGEWGDYSPGVGGRVTRRDVASALVYESAHAAEKRERIAIAAQSMVWSVV